MYSFDKRAKAEGVCELSEVKENFVLVKESSSAKKQQEEYSTGKPPKWKCIFEFGYILSLFFFFLK